LAQVVHMVRAWNVQLWGSGGQRSWSRKAKAGHRNASRRDI